ncbi:MAG: PAS domain-containing sensor histidine kinase [Burkholderiaceae bacterium]|nr:PAS domain-containing sensor histidine kinase [Burkholderiaceae bacterium]
MGTDAGPAHPSLPARRRGAGQDAAFLRLWQGFLTGRVVVALALLMLQLAGQMLNQNAELVVVLVCIVYLGATVTVRLLAGKVAPSPEAGMHWLPSIGVDLALVCALQLLQSGSMSFTPLFGLPILMASVLGTLTLAMGTTAAVTLLLLAWAWWFGDPSGNETTQRSLQAALTGTGYFIVAFMVQQLALRLVREQHIAQSSQATARVQSQVSELVIQNLTEGVLVVDEAFEVRTANPAGLQMLGAQPGLHPPFALHSRPAWQALAALARRSFRQSAPQVADINLISDKQSPIGLHVRTWLTAALSSSADAPGQRLCVMFLHDLRELEARLRTEKLAAMGRMSAAVAHEIRNPLAAIVQANALLDEDLHEPSHKRLAQMIGQNADRLAHIAEEILDIARVQHQMNHAPAAAVALDETVAQIWRDWQAHAPTQRQGLLRLGAPSMQVEFDAEHLRRVLVNLLDNALRYRSGAADSLQLHTRIESPGQASVQVWSDGPPMEQSVERHLFEPFFSSESRSSGLGLYICRGLCERHGASISYQRLQRSVCEKECGGNAFTVRFRSTGILPPPDASLFDTVVV